MTLRVHAVIFNIQVSTGSIALHTKLYCSPYNAIFPIGTSYWMSMSPDENSTRLIFNNYHTVPV